MATASSTTVGSNEQVTSLPYDEASKSLRPLPVAGNAVALDSALDVAVVAAKPDSSSSSARSKGEFSSTDIILQDGEELEMLHAPKHGFNDPRLEAGGDLMHSLESIPNKMAFKIGEAAEMVGVKQYVLRYWESEFEMLRPRKSKNNQRVYSRRDVETALMIKKLLYRDRFSIEGARTALKQLKTQVKEERGLKAMAQSQETAVTKLKGLLTEIRRVREIFC